MLHPSLSLSNAASLSLTAAKASVEDDSKETVATDAVSPLIPNAFEVSCSETYIHQLYFAFS